MCTVSARAVKGTSRNCIVPEEGFQQGERHYLVGVFSCFFVFREVPLTALVSALLHIGKLSHGPVGGRGETARSCLLTLFIAAHCTPQSLHVVYTQCRGGPLPSATRNTYECIKQHFLLIPPFRNILLGETLYSGLDSCTRSAPALLTWA